MARTTRLVRTTCLVVGIGAAAILTSTSVSTRAGAGVPVTTSSAAQAPSAQWVLSVRLTPRQTTPMSPQDAPASRRRGTEPSPDSVKNAAEATVPAAVTGARGATPPAVPAPLPVAPAIHRLVALASPPGYRNRLVSADGSVNTDVGVYSDCRGATPLVRSEAAIDTCIGGVTYFVGHNPGVFTGLLNETVGSTLTYWDGAGTAHPLRIIGRRQWVAANGLVRRLSGATYEFQTCLTPSGSVDWIFDAAPV